MGILGAHLAYLILNFHALGSEQHKELRSQLLCVLCVVIFFNIISGVNFIPMNDLSSDIKTDAYGHLGGLISGFIIGMLCMETIDDSRFA